MLLLRKILWQDKNRWQIFSAAAGVFVGLWLLLSALQLYFDLHHLLKGEQGSGEHFVQINKRVSIFNTLGAQSTFTPEEIAEIEAQPFVRKVGVFQSNRFKVSASSRLVGFYTELFFEAVPPEFLDVDEPGFHWERGQNELPVILSRDYLALYNFGFAPSQGLPQFTPNTIKKVALDVHVQGNGLRMTFQGRVVGFSDRINSILVPWEFLEWANARFGDERRQGPSRLILEVENPYGQAFRQFLEERGYEVSSGRLIGGQVGIVLNLVFGAIALIGVLIFLLAALVVWLSFQLLIAQSRDDIHLLLQLGYRPRQIASELKRYLLLLTGAVVGVLLVFLFLGRGLLLARLEEQGFHLPASFHFLTILAFFLLLGIFLWFNFQTIQRSVERLFPGGAAAK